MELGDVLTLNLYINPGNHYYPNFITEETVAERLYSGKMKKKLKKNRTHSELSRRPMKRKQVESYAVCPERMDQFKGKGGGLWKKVCETEADWVHCTIKYLEGLKDAYFPSRNGYKTKYKEN
jgi:hypothetical protein